MQTTVCPWNLTNEKVDITVSAQDVCQRKSVLFFFCSGHTNTAAFGSQRSKAKQNDLKMRSKIDLKLQR